MLSLAFAALCGGLALHQGFSSEFVVQDDARQHVFWMQRFLNPSLFHNDVIADYFQSIAPIGYAFIYQFAAFFKIDPLFFNKLLPLILGLISTWFAYRVTLQLLPIPLAGFLATLLLNQSLWMKDDLVSGTSRAFAFPLFLAVLDGIVRRSPRLLWSAIALQGLICPSYALISGGLIALRLSLVWLQKLHRQWLEIRHHAVNNPQQEPAELPLPQAIQALTVVIRQRLAQAERQTLWLYGGGLVVLFLALLPVLFLGQNFGPVVSAQVAQTMPEFLSGGRTNIFERDWFDYWFLGRGTNLIPRSLLTPVTLILGLLLPIFLWKPVKRWLPLGNRVTPNIHVLSQFGLVSIGWFLLAHAMLFKLHLPSRYTGHSFRIMIAIATGISATLLIDALLRGIFVRPNRDHSQSHNSQPNPRLFINTHFLARAIGLGGLGVLLLGYPLLVSNFPANSYHVGREPALYQFLKNQPIDTQIASLSSIADDLPTFTGRSILTGKEYAVPYHLGYYRIFRERVLQTIQAQYSTDLWSVKFFLGRYHINFWLLDRAAFSTDYLQDSWLEQYPESTEPALALLQSGQQPIIQSALPKCTALEGKTWLLLDAKCLRLLSPE